MVVATAVRSGRREEIRGMKQRQVWEKAKWALSPGAKKREAGNRHGFIPSAEDRDGSGPLKSRGIPVRWPAPRILLSANFLFVFPLPWIVWSWPYSTIFDKQKIIPKMLLWLCISRREVEEIRKALSFLNKCHKVALELRTKLNLNPSSTSKTVHWPHQPALSCIWHFLNVELSSVDESIHVQQNRSLHSECTLISFIFSLCVFSPVLLDTWSHIKSTLDLLKTPSGR